MAREHSFRNTVAESSLSLPVMAIITFLLWVIGPKWDKELWGTLLLVGLMTYTIVEWNNQCQLLRIRSQMNSVTFLAFLCAFPALRTTGLTFIPAFSLLAAYFMLFKAYGEYKPQGYVFHGFFFLSLGSLFFPPLLLLAPTLFASTNIQLRILTLKSFSALLIGLLLPYWLYIAAMCVAVPVWGIEETRMRYLDFHLPDYSTLTLWHWGALAFIGLLTFVAVVHFVSTAYNDKIRTRQYFYTMLISFVPIIFMTLWWPEDIMITLPLLLLNLTPFAAHYLALAKSHSMTFFFWMWLIILIALGMFNRLDLWSRLPLSF